MCLRRSFSIHFPGRIPGRTSDHIAASSARRTTDSARRSVPQYWRNHPAGWSRRGYGCDKPTTDRSDDQTVRLFQAVQFKGYRTDVVGCHRADVHRFVPVVRTRSAAASCAAPAPRCWMQRSSQWRCKPHNRFRWDCSGSPQNTRITGSST